VHLYLHVPFCARRCSYCDFAIAVRRVTPSEAYADSIIAEWHRWLGSPRLSTTTELATVYFGGGTPSRLAPGSLVRILRTITEDRPTVPGAEVTLEANPDDVTEAAAREWAAAGINRISLGAQSFHPPVLEWMHRTHTAGQIAEAVAMLRAAGITNISLDLIYALPPTLGRDWDRDLDQALALAPDHLSLYGLTVEAHTPLARWVARGIADPAPDERHAEEFLRAHARLSGAGFRHYEVSNYSLPGCEAVHNRAYWLRAPYLGLGPSAHSAMGTHRWWNLHDWEAWNRAIAEGRPTVEGEEVLDSSAVAMEALYLGLRTEHGVEGSLLDASEARTWEGAGWAEQHDGRVRLTPEGWLRLDALVASARPSDRLTV
jgi:oxygen-independent coproporphyrinogen-3 oxidase